MGGAIVGAVAALLGVLVGKYLDALTLSKKHRQEQQSASYVGFLACAEVVNLEFAQTAADFSTQRALAAVVDVTRAAAAVDIWGSAEAAKLAHEVWNFVALELDIHDVAAMSDEQWTAPSQKLRDYLRRFRDVAREDLKGRPIPASIGKTESGPS